MDCEYWMGKARIKIKKFKANHKFFVSDLFDKNEWLELGSKQNHFGRHFISEVRQKKVANVRCLNDDTGQRKRYIYEG